MRFYCARATVTSCRMNASPDTTECSSKITSSFNKRLLFPSNIFIIKLFQTKEPVNIALALVAGMSLLICLIM